MSDATIQVLDWIGGSQRAVERALDTQAGQGEGLLEAFAKARCRARMGLGEGIGQPFELSLGQRRVPAFLGVFDVLPVFRDRLKVE